MINQGASQSNALRHSTRQMVRISVGESFQAEREPRGVPFGYDHRLLHAPHGKSYEQQVRRRVNPRKPEQSRQQKPLRDEKPALGPLMGSSPMSSWPESGESRPAMSRSKVDLPQPLGPTRETSSPGSSDIATRSSASRRGNLPSGAGKLFVNSRRQSAGTTTGSSPFAIRACDHEA